MADPVIRRRNRSNKRRGAMWELALVDWFRSFGHQAERISKKGTRDEGDVVVHIADLVLCIEAKNAARFNLSDWLRQATEQTARWKGDRPSYGEQAFPVVVIKRRQHATSQAYVVMELTAFESLVKRAGA